MPTRSSTDATDGTAVPAVANHLARALAADLRDAGFTAAALREAWGQDADDALGRGLRLPAERALAHRTDALAVLARLLVLGMAQPSDGVTSALPTTGVAGLVDLLLCADDGTSVTPLAALRPQEITDDAGSAEWFLVSDLDETALGAQPLPVDHVLGAGGASLTLAALQLPTPAQSVLDLGTGCAIQSLRARRYATTVVATDLSARALRFAALNLALNEVDDVELRAGSLYEPVLGQRFSRIVSNPPFVVTPRDPEMPAYDYRDGGMEGDALVEAVISGAGEHLEPGGIAQLLGNWEYLAVHGDGREQVEISGLDRVRGWVEAAESPLDAWVVERELLDPVRYAEMWIRDGGILPGTGEHTRLLQAYLEDFERRGVTSIGLGYVLLRRPADGIVSLERYEQVPQALPGEAGLGAHLADVLERHDELRALDDEALLDRSARTAPDVTEVRHHMPGEPGPVVIELRQGSGFARTQQVSAELAAVVGACDGDLTLGQILTAVAALMDLDAEEARAELVPPLRALINDGFLTLE